MIQVIVEGHGEVQAIGNLLSRLSRDMGITNLIFNNPIRIPNIHKNEGLERACEIARTNPKTRGLLIIRDDEDNCPAFVAPNASKIIKDLKLPFPTSYVILYREYETLFLASIESIRGNQITDVSGIKRDGIIENTESLVDLEGPRDAKGWLSNNMPANRVYKPTLDQLPLTRMIDFNLIRQKNLPCFGSLERALSHLSLSTGTSNVYPYTKN